MTPAHLAAAMPLWLQLLITALATARLTRLTTRDSVPLLARPRQYVLDRWPNRAVADLVVCPWCTSPYLAAAVLTAQLTAPAWWVAPATVLAASYAVGWLAEHE